jgi:hypothetical protein
MLHLTTISLKVFEVGFDQSTYCLVSFLRMSE